MVINDKNKFSDALQASSKTFALREMKLIFFGFKPAMSIYQIFGVKEFWQ